MFQTAYAILKLLKIIKNESVVSFKQSCSKIEKLCKLW